MSKYKHKKNKDFLYEFIVSAIIFYFMYRSKGNLSNNFIYDIIYGVIILGVLIVVGNYLRKYLKKIKKRNTYLKSNIRNIDVMTGEEFEEYLGEHFRKQGYKINLTQKTNDYGADLIIKKGNEVIAVQAKRYRDKVGIKAVQEITGALPFYNADKGMVITNSFFTLNAQNLAHTNNIELWDRNKLIKVFSIK